MIKRVYDMEFGLESGDKLYKVRVAQAKDDLTLENVRTAVQPVLDNKVFMKDDVAVKVLNRVMVTEVKELA